MTSDIFLRGKMVHLRPLRKADAAVLVSWMNNEQIRQYLARTFPISVLAVEEWIQLQGKQEKPPTDVVFVIENATDGNAIGIISIHQIDWVNRNCLTGTVIGEVDFQCKGYATDAKMLVLKYVFDSLGMHKVISHAFARNKRSIAYSEKCGYVFEATLKEEKWKEGEWQDIVVLACFRANWKEKWDEYMR